MKLWKNVQKTSLLGVKGGVNLSEEVRRGTHPSGLSVSFTKRSGISPTQNVSRINPVVGRVGFLMGRLQNSLSLGFPTGDSVLKVVREGRPFKICDICWEFPRNMFRVKGTNKLRS